MLFEMFWNDFFARQMGVNFSSSGLRSLFSFKFHSVCNLINYTDNSDFHWYLNENIEKNLLSDNLIQLLWNFIKVLGQDWNMSGRNMLNLVL